MPRFVGVLAFGLVAVLASASARAEDRWVGPYIGVNLGYGFGDLDGGLTVFQPNSSVPYPTGPLNYNVEPDGSFAGLQIGINGPSGPFFSGIEFDIQTNISGTSKTDFAPPSIFPFNYRATASIDWFTTLRARLGLATKDTLLYATGGLAVGHVSYEARYLITAVAPGGFANIKSADTQIGYVLGAGVEQALGRNWSLKLEYQYLNFGDQHADGDLHFVNGVPSNEKVTTDFATDLHTVRLGLNYRFK